MGVKKVIIPVEAALMLAGCTAGDTSKLTTKEVGATEIELYVEDVETGVGKVDYVNMVVKGIQEIGDAYGGSVSVGEVGVF